MKERKEGRKKGRKEKRKEREEEGRGTKGRRRKKIIGMKEGNFLKSKSFLYYESQNFIFPFLHYNHPYKND